MEVSLGELTFVCSNQNPIDGSGTFLTRCFFSRFHSAHLGLKLMPLTLHYVIDLSGGELWFTGGGTESPEDCAATDDSGKKNGGHVAGEKKKQTNKQQVRYFSDKWKTTVSGCVKSKHRCLHKFYICSRGIKYSEWAFCLDRSCITGSKSVIYRRCRHTINNQHQTTPRICIWLRLITVLIRTFLREYL